MIWNVRKQKTTNQNNKRKKESKKPECKETLGQLQAYQHSPHRGARGKEKEQEIGNLSEKIMKKNFSDLVKEIQMQIQKAQRVSNKMDAKRPTPRHIIMKMLKVKDKKI